MRIKPQLYSFLILVVLLLTAQTVSAQSAEEYFHNGGQSYIHSNLQDAISYVNEGLAKYPSDPKLTALLQKLEEEQKKQQQQDQQQQNQEENQQNQEQQQDQQQQNEEQQQQQEQQPDGENGDEENDPQQQAQQMGQMSKENAEKILQALAQKEKELLKEFKKKNTRGSAKHEKDW